MSSPTSQRQALRAPGGSSADLDSAASTWFSPREGDSAFDDYDDEEEDRAGSSAGKGFGSKNRWHGDFDIGVNPPSQTRKIHDSTAGSQHARQDRFGFDAARFGSADSDDEEEEDDDGFGPFSDSYAAEPSPGAVMATVKGYTFDDDFATGSPGAQSTAVREKLTRKADNNT